MSGNSGPSTSPHLPPPKRSRTSSQEDVDGDSTMHSSPASSADADEDLFPDADNAATTANAAAALANPSTPVLRAATAELSPPSSQGASGSRVGITSMPRSDTPLTGDAGMGGGVTINANGKRMYPATTWPSDIGVGASSSSSAAAAGAAAEPGASSSVFGNVFGASSSGIGAGAGGSGGQLAPQVHAPSGYTWTRESDAPGWAWFHKKAQEEWAKAEDSLMDRDRMIKDKYGDPFDWTPIRT